MRHPLLWLLARCQIAVWNLSEIVALYKVQDWAELRKRDLDQARSDVKWLFFIAVTGYGPILP